MRLRSRRLLSVLALTLSFGLLAAPAAGALPEKERRALSLADVKRERADRSSLVVCDDLNRVAERWSRRMARSGDLAHNPRTRDEIGRWTRWGEIVGTASTVDDAMRAFFGSSGHAGHLLSGEYTETGIGVVRDDGRIWVTQIFRDPAGSACRS